MPGQTSAPYLAARDVPPAQGRSAMLERVMAHWQGLLRAALAPLDLTTAQYHLLVAAAWLGARQPAVRQSDIATHANLDAVMTSEVLRTLERRGLVERTAHPTDRRAKAIIVTASGGAIADKAARLVDAIEAKFFETGMPEFGALAKLLKKGGRGETAR
ncbi:MAG TPA: MarR family transcriptional regulator [Gemmatimonadaceae bacterium]|nr:MarR family transcriptional regulator [Gemmatimonadaceae bacterium]